MRETWKAVVGYEGLYEVSDMGRVRSLDRVIESGNRWGGVSRRRCKGVVLKPWPISKKAGYVALYLSVAGEIKACTVHSLVCRAFHGPAPTARHEVAHSDGDDTNNQASNLTWKTRIANHADKRRHGTHMCGERVPWAKLTDKTVRRMRELRRETGVSYESIGAAFGVSRRTAARAISGQHWAHIA